MSNKETLLCYIHGYAGAPGHWDGLRKRMATRSIHSHPEVVVTLAGHGRKTLVPGPFDIETCARDVLQSLGDYPAILIGHSMGTRIAMEIASLAPAQVRGLLLVDGSNVPCDAAQIARDLQSRIDKHGYVPVMEKTMRSMLIDGLDDSVQATMLGNIKQLSQEAAIDYEASMAAWDTECFPLRIESIDQPVSIVQSTSLLVDRGWERVPIDRQPGSLWLEAWSSRPGVDIHRLSGCGHYCMMEAPEFIAQQLTALIERSNQSGDQPAPAAAVNRLSGGS